MVVPSEKNGTSSDSGRGNPTAGVSDQIYAPYLEHRKYLIESELDVAKSYDRWLLTLSGGALGLSMTFAGDIASDSGVTSPSLLLVGWLGFCAAIALGLTSIYVSQRAHEESRVVLDATMQDFVESGRKAGFWAEVGRRQSKCWRSKFVGRLNQVSGAAFVLGIVFLSVFACNNVTHLEKSNHGPKLKRVPQEIPSSPAPDTIRR